MEQSNIVDLDIILRGFRKKNGQSAYENLCSKIMSLRPKGFDGDYEKFAAEMIERFKNGRYPFSDYEKFAAEMIERFKNGEYPFS